MHRHQHMPGKVMKEKIKKEMKLAAANMMLNLTSCKGELRSTMIRQGAVALISNISENSDPKTRAQCVVALGNLAMDTHGDGRAAILYYLRSSNFVTRKIQSPVEDVHPRCVQ